MTETTLTTADVAAWLQCSPRKVTDTAKAHGIGMDLGGRAGFRFTEADKLLLSDALKPAVVKPIRRRKRRAA